MQVTDGSGYIFGPHGLQVNGADGKPKVISGGGATPTGYYLQYLDEITQPLGAANVGQEVRFRTPDITNGISMVNDTKITFAHTGIYNLQFSFQFKNIDVQDHDVVVWLRKNGVDVLGSSGYVDVAASHGGVPGHIIVAWNYLLDVVGGDYYEMIWSGTSMDVTMEFYPAGSPPPSAASAILTVTQQSGIMAGTGMTALNGLSADVQTISTGTTGTDFNVISSGTDHQFNLPTASALTRGALSTTDWTTFNDKQTALVSGTNIKTINGGSILSSGNILLQTILISGTNIKTVNGTSLMGSGNINTNPRTLTSMNGTNLTGTANQISASYMIPANTLVTNNTIDIRSLLTKSAGSTTSTARMYINTTNSLTGATLIGTAGAMNAATYIQKFWRSFFYDGTNLCVYNPANGISSDITSGTLTSVPFNRTINNYLIFAVQNGTTTPDDLGHKRVIVMLYD
jgi:hypothetical protein